MCRDQVDQQHPANEVTTRKYRDLPMRSPRSPINKKTAEEFVLRPVQAKFHLCEGSHENKNETHCKTKHGKPKRGKEINQPMQQPSMRRTRYGRSWRRSCTLCALPLFLFATFI